MMIIDERRLLMKADAAAAQDRGSLMAGREGWAGRTWQVKKETLAFSLPYALIYLIPLGFVLSHPLSARGVLAVVLILCSAGIYVASWFLNPIVPRRTPAQTVVTTVALTAFTLAATLSYPVEGNEQWWTLQMFAFVASAWTLQAGKGAVLPGLGILFVFLAVTCWSMGALLPMFAVGVGTTFGVALICGVSRWSIERQERLDLEAEHRHRELLENDRQLISAELHDVLGQELAGIVIKTQLLERLLQVNEEERAIEQAKEIGAMARRALDDVRVVVARTRDWSVSEELNGAQDLLGAAGIECTVTATQGALTGTQARIYARIIREGTTNVLRHSTASWCSISVSDDHLEMRNNGCARQVASESGLAALAKQSEPVGKLSWERQGTEWTLRFMKSAS